jgi:hypothetical protein
MAGKWFATQGDYANRWGEVLNGSDGLTITTRIPRSLADQLHFNAGKLDGTGPGYYADRASSADQRADERNRVVAMMEKIENPVAEALVRWHTADEGGRTSDQATAPVYMATAVFVLGGEAEVQPGWPASADQLSILLQETECLDDGRRRCLVGFLLPDLAHPHLYRGAQLLVLEGPRTVASAQLATVYGQEDE